MLHPTMVPPTRRRREMALEDSAGGVLEGRDHKGGGEHEDALVAQGVGGELAVTVISISADMPGARGEVMGSSSTATRAPGQRAGKSSICRPQSTSRVSIRRRNARSVIQSRSRRPIHAPRS